MNKTRIFLSLLLLTLGINALFFTLFYISLNYGYIKLPIFINNLSGSKIEILPETKKTVIERKIKEEINIYDLQNQVIKAIKKLSPSVVSVVISKNLKVFIENPYDFFGGHVVEKKEKIGGGSGIIVTKDGYIITNKHVIQDPNADYTVVTSDGQVYNVQNIWIDPVLDFAVLKVVDKNGNPPINLKPADIKPLAADVKVGQFVIAIGNALAQYSNTATFGIISALGRNLNDLDSQTNSVYIGLYQTDAAINPGNSGGPLANINGQVIGINTAISAIGQGIGFSLPISKEFVDATLKSIKKYGKIVRPFLGIEFVDLNPSIAKAKNLTQLEGALVKKVLPGTPAAKAGLQPGDIILKINDIDINLTHPLLYVIYTYLPGDKVSLLIDRNGKLIKKEVILGKLKF